jgi:hypothetical protein
MDASEIINFFSWVAIFLLSISYWFQIFKIHAKGEVRGLSMTYHVLLAIGFGTLAITAFFEGSLIFLVKQISTTIPVVVIIAQIVFHRKRNRVEEQNLICSDCLGHIEREWAFCAHCGAEVRIGVVEIKSTEDRSQYSDGKTSDG